MLHFICNGCPDHTCHADISTFHGKMPDGCFMTKGMPASWTVDETDMYLLHKSANLGSQRALFLIRQIEDAIAENTVTHKQG